MKNKISAFLGREGRRRRRHHKESEGQKQNSQS
jgi:hypothetical protein